MNWSILQNRNEYERALQRIEALSQNPPALKSEEGQELLLLGFLTDQYEEKEFPIQSPDPIDAIKVRMEQLGLSINDLLNVFGDRGTASKVLNHQRNLSLTMIRMLEDRLSLPASLLIQQASAKKYSIKNKQKPLQLHESRAGYRKRKKR